MSIPWQAPPARQRPPLSKRLQPRHWAALDYAAAVPCALVMFLNGTRSALHYGASGHGLSGVAVSIAIAVAVSLPVALRRRNPLAALAASAAAAVIAPLIIAVVATTPVAVTQAQSLPAAGQAAFQSAGVYFLPAAYVIYLVAARYRRKVAAAALGVVLLLLLTEAVIVGLSSHFGVGPAVFAALVMMIFWMVGYAAGQRRAYAAQLQHQAAAGAVTEERLRIARELHDVVAHSMTVIAVQAGYGHHVIDSQPGKAREALGAIQVTSREALAEMRRMLGVLRQSGPVPSGPVPSGPVPSGVGPSGPVPSGLVSSGLGPSGDALAGDAAGMPVTVPAGTPAAPPASPPAGVSAGVPAAPLAPAPGLGDLDRLVARIGNAGVTVDLRVHGNRRQLPPGIDLAAFRIVQEALTNVVKHADTPSCTVTISYQEDGLSIEVADRGRGCPVPAGAGPRANPAADQTGGHGLIGMRERVSLYGGQLTAQPLPERGFLVAARLPTPGGSP